MNSPNLISVDYRNKEEVNAMAKLHDELLGYGPIPQLGYEFMTEFYYKKLVEAGLIKCDLYKYNGKYIGFSSYTKYPFTFMREGMRRFLFYLVFLLFKILLLDIRQMRTIVNVIKIGHKRRLQKIEGETGEILSFGVLRDYGNLRDKATGVRITNLLFENVLNYLKTEGMKKVQGEILKNNKPSLLLWHSYGGVIKDYNWGRENSYLVVIDL